MFTEYEVIKNHYNWINSLAITPIILAAFILFCVSIVLCRVSIKKKKKTFVSSQTKKKKKMIYKI